MKTSLFLLSALLILVVSCKKEPATTATSYQIATTVRDSSNKAIFNGNFTQESEPVKWIDTDWSEDSCKRWKLKNTTGYSHLDPLDRNDTIYYQRRMAYYRAKP